MEKEDFKEAFWLQAGDKKLVLKKEFLDKFLYLIEKKDLTDAVRKHNEKMKRDIESLAQKALKQLGIKAEKGKILDTVIYNQRIFKTLLLNSLENDLNDLKELDGLEVGLNPEIDNLLVPNYESLSKIYNVYDLVKTSNQINEFKKFLDTKEVCFCFRVTKYYKESM